jgi:NAD(P)-dependent dehydrogenase (short-subunit alcohol dehydrogenase family)
MRPIDQQVILITGSTDGHGRLVARDLAARGATVLSHGRDPDRGNRCSRKSVASVTVSHTASI